MTARGCKPDRAIRENAAIKLIGPALRGDPATLRACFPPLPGAIEPAAKDRAPPPRFKQADVTRAIKAVRSAGLNITGTEVCSDGTIRILTQQTGEQETSPYERWKARRGAGSA